MPMYPRFHLGPGQNQVGGNLEESHGLTEMRPLGVAAHAQVGTVHLPQQQIQALGLRMSREPQVKTHSKTGNL